MSLNTNIVNGVVTVVAPQVATEIDIPFRIDPTGAIANTNDENARAVEHMLALAMTRPGERVMRPTYGVGLSNLVFANSEAITFQNVAIALQNAFATTETSLTNVTVSVIAQGGGSSYLFQVDFTVDQDPTIHQAVFNYAGQLIGST